MLNITDEAQREALAERLAECGTIRPGTLGYQRCELPADHEGAHRSQDRREWVADEGPSSATCPLHGADCEAWA